LPGHAEFLIHQHPKVLLKAALNPFSAQPVFVLGIAPTHVQDLALGLVEPLEVCMGPLLKPVKVPLDSISLNIKKKDPFIIRVIQHWNRFLRAVVESQSLEILKTGLDVFLSELL